MTVLALCNNSNNKKKKTSKEKATLKDNKPKPAEVKTAEKPKQQSPVVTALSNTKTGSDEVVETKTAIAGDSPKDFRTVQEEDSFDRLQPRQIYANRYKKIADAPKVNRKDAEYDTLKMFANGGGLSQQMSVQN